jgi:hypothetical protein
MLILPKIEDTFPFLYIVKQIFLHGKIVIRVGHAANIVM